MKKKAISLILAAVLISVAFYFTISSHSVNQFVDSFVELQPANPASAEIVDSPDAPQAAAPLVFPTQSQVKSSMPDHKEDEETQTPVQENSRVLLLERLEPILQEQLAGEGFSQSEIDLTTKEVVSEYTKSEGVINFSDAVNRTAKALNFDDDRRSKLNIAVLKSAAQSVEITFDQWNQCLNHRIKTMPQCVQDIAQDLSRNIAAATSGQSLLGEVRSKSVELSKKSMADAVKKCGITKDDADRALRVVLSDCP